MPFVKSSKNNTTTAQKLASRVCATCLIESFEGDYIPKGHKEYLKDTNIKFLSKIKTKREKNSIFKAKKQVIERRPIIQDNKYCIPSTHLQIELNIKNIYKKLAELNIFQSDNNCYFIPLKDNNLFPNLIITFHIHPTDKIIMKIEAKKILSKQTDQ